MEKYYCFFKEKDLGQLIRCLRKQQKMAQSTLAYRIGVTQSHLSQIENNKNKISVTLLYKILSILNAEICVHAKYDQ